MKRFLLLALCLLWFAPPGFAVSKEIIQLQQNVALLQGMVQELQRSFTEKTAVMQTLMGQSSNKLNQIDQANGKLNTTMSQLQQALQNSLANTGQKVDNLNTELQGLQSSLDELRARLDKLSAQVAKLTAYQQTIPTGMSSPGVPGAPGSPTFPNAPPSGSLAPGPGSPSPDVLYNTALRDYTSGNYPLSLQEFTDYLRYYPTTTLASNAQFYIGDIYYQQGQFEKAIQEYDKAIEQYPNGNKTAAAELKKGYALLNMNLRTQGVRELKNLIKNFPHTPEASLAKDKLATLSPAKSRRRSRSGG